MHHRTVNFASRVAAQLDFEKAKTLLDLGGRPGTCAMAFLAQYPHLRATVCDRAAGLAVAGQIASSHKARTACHSLRVTLWRRICRVGMKSSGILTFFISIRPEKNWAVFRRVYAVLAPGGRPIIQNAFLQDSNGLYPEEASLFAVSMLLYTERGNTYSRRETVERLRDAGFVRGRSLRNGTEDWDGGLLEAVRQVGR